MCFETTSLFLPRGLQDKEKVHFTFWFVYTLLRSTLSPRLRAHERKAGQYTMNIVFVLCLLSFD